MGFYWILVIDLLFFDDLFFFSFNCFIKPTRNKNSISYADILHGFDFLEFSITCNTPSNDKSPSRNVDLYLSLFKTLVRILRVESYFFKTRFFISCDTLENASRVLLNSIYISIPCWLDQILLCNILEYIFDAFMKLITYILYLIFFNIFTRKFIFS